MHEALAAFRPPGSASPPPSQPAQQPTQQQSRGSNVLGLFARHPELAKAYFTFNRHLLYASSLTARQRELVILRVAYLRRAEYEWAQHVQIGIDAGLDPEEIEWVAEDLDRSEWGSLDRAMLQAVDDLLSSAEVSETTWEDLAGYLDEHQLMDLVFTVGCYEMLAMVFQSCGLDPEESLVPYLPQTTGVWDRKVLQSVTETG
jgi:alkylhydroperoxidase family enzyme